MNAQRVVTVVRKEVREFRRNRFVVGTMTVMPLVFLITPMITMFRIPDSASGPQVRAAVGALSLLMLIVPIVIPPVIAAYSVVGERDQGTLEPVLTAPVRASELLLGKAVAAFIPSVGVAYLIYFIAAISIRVRRRRRCDKRRVGRTADAGPDPVHPAPRAVVDLGRHRHLHPRQRRPCRTAARHARGTAAARVHLAALVPGDHPDSAARDRPRPRPRSSSMSLLGASSRSSSTASASSRGPTADPSQTRPADAGPNLCGPPGSRQDRRSARRRVRQAVPMTCNSTVRPWASPTAG